MVSPIPTTALTMCRYIVSLSLTLKYVTIDNYVSGVISLNKYYGCDVFFIRQDFTFKTTMAGIRRVLGDPSPERPTLSVGNLLDMFQKIVLSDVNHRTMWACIVLSFRALLRKSNLVPNTLKEARSSSSHFLRRGAVSFHEYGMLINVSSSKTIQYGQRLHKIPVTYSKGSPLCAVSFLRRHFDEFPVVTRDSPAFILQYNDGTRPLLYPVLLKFLKFLLSSIDLELNRAGMHSLRRAGAAYMHSIGISLEDIRDTGDWASMAALIYLTKPLDIKIVVDQTISSDLSKLCI